MSPFQNISCLHPVIISLCRNIGCRENLGNSGGEWSHGSGLYRETGDSSGGGERGIFSVRMGGWWESECPL